MSNDLEVRVQDNGDLKESMFVNNACLCQQPIQLEIL